MENRKSFVSYLPGVFFAGLLMIGFVFGQYYRKIPSLLSLANPKSTVDFDALESDLSESLPGRDALIDLNGSIAKVLNVQSLYGNLGIYVTHDKQIVGMYPMTSTDYEYKQTVEFKEFLSENGINLLYVNEPTKYTDDFAFTKELGIDTYTNRNMDLFLERIGKAGVNAIDLRESIKKENIDVSTLFYKTDHHWTTEAGLWASRIMAEGLNEYCGYNIDTGIFDRSNFTFKEWKNSWLGELGHKLAASYTGLDDYTEIKPNFETSYGFRNPSGEYVQGTFDNFIDESCYSKTGTVYENGSWYYSYKTTGSVNNNVRAGKILLLGDSFDHVIVPFLSLAVHKLDFKCLRTAAADFDLHKYILDEGYDTVIVAYAQFMLGAHDDPENSNYRLYEFDGKY